MIIAQENGEPIGFMGIANGMLEMLFISNENRGHGIGKKLIQYGIDNYSFKLCAYAFYRSRTDHRTEA